jgi:hypothetical protein
MAALLRRPCTLYRVARPAGEEAGVVVVVDGDEEDTEEFRGWLHPVQVDAPAGRLLLHRGLFRRTTLTIVDTQARASLYEALPLEPWAAEPEAGPLYLWIADTEVFATTVTQCLRLHSDQIRYARLQEPGPDCERDGTTVPDYKRNYLLRLAQPPYFLVQEWVTAADTHTVFVPTGTPGVAVQWGYRHPLQDYLQPPPEGTLLFLPAAGPWRRAAGDDLRDIYEALRIDPDCFTTTDWQPVAEPTRFHVPLRFLPLSTPQEPELWRLPMEELERLERLLAVAPEEDLRNLLISFQETEDGERFCFVRELIAGQTRSYLDFGGRAYRSYLGYNNLFVPVGTLLEPALRRDKYREALGLNPAELTVLEEGPEGRIEVLCLATNSFRPITELIDYLLAEHATRLRTIAREVVFATDDYEYVGPPLPLRIADCGLRSPEGGSRNPKSEEPAADPHARPHSERSQPFLERLDQKDGETSPADEEPKAEPASPSPTAEEQAEAEAEKAVAFGEGNVEEWVHLGRVKLRLGRAKGDPEKVEEGLRCLESGLWLLEEGPSAEVLKAEMIRALEEHFGVSGTTPAERLAALDHLPADPLQVGLRLRLAVLYYGAGIGDVADQGRLADLYQALRQQGPHLPKKTRWLLWQDIFRHNWDDYTAEQQREEILGELNRSGLGPADRFPFVREQLNRHLGDQP